MAGSSHAVTIPINVGPLNGVPSFCFHTAQSLKRFSKLYNEGKRPQVEWDLRNVEFRHMSMAGLAAFIATAYRMRKFTTEAPFIRLSWNPQVFSFWEDISLFKVTREHDLFKWPEAVSDGSWFGDTNPNTELLLFDYSDALPDRSDDLQYWKDWKDSVRQRFKDVLFLKCGRLFKSQSHGRYFSEKLRDQVAIASSELVVNCMLWGRSAAVVGLQRTSAGITVAVCDSGRGFHSSLYDQHSSKQIVYPENNLEALIVGSLINTREYGLRRVIGTVMRNGGKVLMSSFDAEIHWKEALWNEVQLATVKTDEHPIDIEFLKKTVGKPVTGSPSEYDRENGFCRIWKYGLRGARIAFELPIPR